MVIRHSGFFIYFLDVRYHHFMPPPPLPRILLFACLFASALIALGCDTATPIQQTPRGDEYPPDFALVFHVAGSADATGALGRSAQHIVEPSRKLRVALGPGTSSETYPPVTARLRPADMARLYRIAKAAGLDQPPATSPPQTQAGWVRYRIRLTAHGRTYDHTTDPELNPAAHQLLAELVRLRQGR